MWPRRRSFWVSSPCNRDSPSSDTASERFELRDSVAREVGVSYLNLDQAESRCEFRWIGRTACERSAPRRVAVTDAGARRKERSGGQRQRNRTPPGRRRGPEAALYAGRRRSVGLGLRRRPGPRRASSASATGARTCCASSPTTGGVEMRWICDLDADRLARFARRYPPRRADRRVRGPARRPRGRRGRDRDAGLHPLRARRARASRPASTRSSRSRWPPSRGRGRRAARARATTRARADVRPHVPLQPAGPRGQGACSTRGELGELYFISSSRVNLGLHQRDVSVIWDLGPHDFSILRYWLGEMPESVAAIGRDSIVAGHPRRRLRHPALPVGHRSPTSS